MLTATKALATIAGVGLTAAGAALFALMMTGGANPTETQPTARPTTLAEREKLCEELVALQHPGMTGSEQRIRVLVCALDR